MDDLVINEEGCPMAEFAPPVLQPYDGLPPPSLTERDDPPTLPSYSTPNLSPPHPPASSPGPPPLSQPAPPLRPVERIDDIKKHNLKVRSAAYKEVRRPGRNFDRLLEHLEEMKGTPEMKINLLKDIINESLRFKRRNLASLLDKQLKELKNVASLSNHLGNNGSR